MPILPPDFLDSENCPSEIAYEETHGLPQRAMFPESRAPGTLFVVKNRTPFLLHEFKSLYGGDEVAIQKDAYLLWRLSERYGISPFSLGRLDADRTKRLWQLRAIEFDSASYGGEITSQTLITIQWDRMPLRHHFVRLITNVHSVRNDENQR
jgi:hypothetical protein